MKEGEEENRKAEFVFQSELIREICRSEKVDVLSR